MTRLWLNCKISICDSWAQANVILSNFQSLAELKGLLWVHNTVRWCGIFRFGFARVWTISLSRYCIILLNVVWPLNYRNIQQRKVGVNEKHNPWKYIMKKCNLPWAGRVGVKDGIFSIGMWVDGRGSGRLMHVRSGVNCRRFWNMLIIAIFICNTSVDENLSSWANKRPK